MWKLALLVAVLGALSLGACGGSAKTVCHVRPGPGGGLSYSPPGCQHHLGPGMTLDIQTR